MIDEPPLTSNALFDIMLVAMKNRGIPYFDDLACLLALKKCHKRGYRNIYSVRISYVQPDKVGHPIKRKEYRMDYGNFKLADNRFNIETNSACPSPSKWKLEEVKMVLLTCKDAKVVNEDVMRSKKFETYINHFEY